MCCSLEQFDYLPTCTNLNNFITPIAAATVAADRLSSSSSSLLLLLLLLLLPLHLLLLFISQLLLSTQSSVFTPVERHLNKRATLKASGGKTSTLSRHYTNHGRSVRSLCSTHDNTRPLKNSNHYSCVKYLLTRSELKIFMHNNKPATTVTDF